MEREGLRRNRTDRQTDSRTKRLTYRLGGIARVYSRRRCNSTQDAHFQGAIYASQVASSLFATSRATASKLLPVLAEVNLFLQYTLQRYTSFLYFRGDRLYLHYTTVAQPESYIPSPSTWSIPILVSVLYARGIRNDTRERVQSGDWKIWMNMRMKNGERDEKIEKKRQAKQNINDWVTHDAVVTPDHSWRWIRNILHEASQVDGASFIHKKIRGSDNNGDWLWNSEGI